MKRGGERLERLERRKQRQRQLEELEALAAAQDRPNATVPDPDFVINGSTPSTSATGELEQQWLDVGTSVCVRESAL